MAFCLSNTPIDPTNKESVIDALGELMAIFDEQPIHAAKHVAELERLECKALLLTALEMIDSLGDAMAALVVGNATATTIDVPAEFAAWLGMGDPQATTQDKGWATEPQYNKRCKHCGRAVTHIMEDGHQMLVHVATGDIPCFQQTAKI